MPTYNGPGQERRCVPGHTWCHECRMVVAPYAEHIRFGGKTFHTDCYRRWWHRKTAERTPVRMAAR